MSFFQFQVPTKIMHDFGLSEDFAHELQMMDVQKIFVVTDEFLKTSGLCEPILNHLKENEIEVVGIFSDVPPDSSVKVVEDCAAQAKEAGAQALLAIGGGSVLDTAKGANILFTLGGDLKEDYSGAQTITQGLSPLIAIPTTAGTGSEVTEAIVIYDEESQTKLSFVDSHLLPKLTVLDPKITFGMPAKLTAATGLDALTHAIEAVMSVQHNPVSDALAYQAISYLYHYLPKVIENGEDEEARSKVLVASNLAGMAFNHAMVGVVHAVAHSVGAVARVHHGTANGIFLPFGMEYNLPEAASRIASLALSLEVSVFGDEEKDAQSVIDAVRKFVLAVSEKAGVPKTYREAGVKEEDLEKIAEKSVEDGASFYNPREVSLEKILPFLKRAFG